MIPVALRILHWLVLLLALMPFLYYFLCLFAATRFARRNRLPCASVSGPLPPISILKPVRGADRGAYDNFRSFCTLDYPSYEVLFCVGDTGEPAVPIIEQLIRETPGRSIRVLVGAEALGVNDKLNKLCRLVREARYDLLVMSDSDTRVDPSYLRVTAGAFADPGVGAATMIFRSDVDGSLVSCLDSLGAGTDFWANTILHAQLQGGLRTTHGATMAVRRSLLLQAGGWESRVNHHSDDHWLGQAIASLGHGVALLPSALWMVYPAQSFRSYLRHELLRYIRIRTTVPWGYAGFALTHGLPWALAAAFVAPSLAVAASYLLAYLFLRSWMVWWIGSRVLGDPLVPRIWWLAPLRDALAFCVWLAAFFTNRIERRGLRFRSLKGGRLVPIPPPSEDA